MAKPGIPHHLHGPFGESDFGRWAERFARFFGTPNFIIGQTLIVIVWIALNAIAISLRWDPYPFILLNLAFSTQAAYAAPLILLAQTRQADRDKAREDAVQEHREAEAARVQRFEDQQAKALAEDRDLTAGQAKMGRQHAEMLEQNTALTAQVGKMLEQNTELTKQVVGLTAELHATVCGPKPPA
jgi:uncharacterized membrane protein